MQDRTGPVAAGLGRVIVFQHVLPAAEAAPDGVLLGRVVAAGPDLVHLQLARAEDRVSQVIIPQAVDLGRCCHVQDLEVRELDPGAAAARPHADLPGRDRRRPGRHRAAERKPGRAFHDLLDRAAAHLAAHVEGPAGQADRIGRGVAPQRPTVRRGIARHLPKLVALGGPITDQHPEVVLIHVAEHDAAVLGRARQRQAHRKLDVLVLRLVDQVNRAAISTRQLENNLNFISCMKKPKIHKWSENLH